MIKGLVAIVGRPNVGKSTLFNRLTKTDKAIVDDQPGVTRDRIYGTAYYDVERENGFMVVDTGGFETDDFKFQPFAENVVWQQTEAAIMEADLVILVLDGKHGLHQHDQELIRFLENKNKAFICIINKVDGEEKRQESLWDFYSLGKDEFLTVSAAHNKGIRELRDLIQDSLSGLKVSSGWDEKDAIKVALIGRPNAGKSSILNRLTGEERAVVSPIAGTTRDSLDSKVNYNNKTYVLIDTAGIRRKTKVSEKLEVLSVVRSIRAIDRADVVLLVIDALEGITDQDARLINLTLDRFKPLLIVVNKWDLVPDKDSKTAQVYADNIRKVILQDLSFLPVAFVSCKTNQRVHGLMERIDRINNMNKMRFPTFKINEILHAAVAKHTPQLVKKYSKRVKFYYATQVRAEPPTIVIKCNISDEIQESYKRYLTNRFREALELDEVPIRLHFRGKSESKGGKKLEKRDIEELEGQGIDPVGEEEQ